MMSQRKISATLVATFLSTVLLLATPPAAQAGFFLVLQSGGLTQVIGDNGAGDTNSTTGNITNTTSIGNFSVVSTSGTSKPLYSSPPGHIDLTNFSLSTSTGGSLTVTLFDTGFNLGTGPMSYTSVLGGTLAPQSSSAGMGGEAFLSMGSQPPSAQMTAQSWVDPSNSITATTPSTFGGVPAGSIPVFTPTAYDTGAVTSQTSFNTSGSQSINLSGNWALVNQVTFTFTGAGSGSVDFDTQVNPGGGGPGPGGGSAPVPSSVLLVVSALPFLALGYWRRCRAALPI